jgi:hypothetical protein
MRDFLKSSGHYLRVGWFWPLALLALPNCAFQTQGLPNPNAFNGGAEPMSDVIMCDIPQPADVVNDCAAATPGLSLAKGAVALNTGENNTVGLDFSAAAIAACGGPRKTVFFNAFPDGTPVCVNATQMIPAVYADGNAVCVAKCKELVSIDQPEANLDSFCQANAHVSTNFDKSSHFSNACSSDGVFDAAHFSDPRRVPEDMIWAEQNGTKGGTQGTSISRTAGRSGNFDAGAYSKASITHGDAWVEFQVNDNTKAYAVGFSSTASALETLADIPFALVLQADGTLAIFQAGVQVPGSFGTYNSGDAFRVHVTENPDGSNTATLSATRVNGVCVPDAMCSETPIATATGPSPAYPLAVDVSLVDPAPAALTHVSMMRIQ